MGGKTQCYRCGRCGHWSKECPRNSCERVHSSYRFNRYSPYGSPRVSPAHNSRTFDSRVDHYKRLEYFRDYIYDRRLPFPDPYERYGLPPEFYRRSEMTYRRPPLPAPMIDEYYERRIRDRYSFM